MKTASWVLSSVVALAICSMTPVFGQGEANVTASPYLQNFDSIGAATNAVLPTGFKFSPTNLPTVTSATWTNTANFTSTTQQASSGTPTTGGRYNWGATGGTDRAVGFMTSASYAGNNCLIAGFTNNTGNTITQILVTAVWERYRINTAGHTQLVYYSTDGKTWGTHLYSNVTPGATSAYGYPLASNVASLTVGNQTIPPGGAFYLLFTFSTPGSNGQGWGVDDLQLTLQYASSVQPPTLTSPTAASIGQTYATLGATITSDGGDAILERGTVYGPSENPVINGLAEGETTTGTFAHVRSGLNQGTRYYYRGYAVNSAGTGYSPNGSFYTEPGQASDIIFTNVSANSMRISWSAGPDSDGSLVVVRSGNANVSDPTDGVLHTANASFGDGEDLGGGSYVVYRGSSTQVDVTGLSPNTTYYVEIFAYRGTVADSGADLGINYRQLSPAAGNRTTPDTPPTRWTALYNRGQPVWTYYLGDPLLYVYEFAINTDTSGWTVEYGLGQTTGGSGWTWRSAEWSRMDGAENRVWKSKGSEHQFTSTGTWYYAGRFITGNYTYYVDRDWVANNGQALEAESYFSVLPLETPSAVSAERDSTYPATRVDLSWSQWSGRNVLITRSTAAPTGSPTQGTAYSAGQTFGNQTVVAGSQSGTALEVTGLTPGQTYYFTFYSENYSYYSTGVVASVTLAMPQARNTDGGNPQAPAVIYLGDSGLTFGLDSWGQLEANWGRARLWLRAGNASLPGGTASEWSDFTNAENKTRPSGVFNVTGTWYWGIQLDYGEPYGTNFWYKASSSSWTDLSASGTGASLTVTVSAINDPTNQTAARSESEPTSRIELGWEKNAQDHNVMVVRKLAGSSWTEPTQGTGYSAGDLIGAGTVVYNGPATAASATGLVADTTYDFKFYSVNNNYYSPGVTAQASTRGCAPDAPTGLHASETNVYNFTAAWNAVEGATGYRLDVSTNATFTGGGGTTTDVIQQETMGTTGTSGDSIATHEANNRFVNVALTMSGTGDMRNTSASSGYPGASASFNVMLNQTNEYFQMAGINAAGFTNLKLYYGIRKATTTENGSTMLIEASTNGTDWVSCGPVSLPTGTGTATWFYRTNDVPNSMAGANLIIRFTSTSNTEFRIDDVLLRGTLPDPSYVPGYSNLAVAGTSQVVTGLEMTTTYYFRVRAEGEGGCSSANSATASVTTRQGVQNQTINFPPIGDKLTTDTVGLFATASSGLPVEFSVLSGPAVITGLTNLSFTGAGEVRIVANQPGNEYWNPASEVTNTFMVYKATAAVTLLNLNQPYDGGARTVTATTDPSGLTVEITYDGSATPPVNPGSYTVVGTVVDNIYQGGKTGTLVVSVAAPGSLTATPTGVSTIQLSFSLNGQGNPAVIVYNLTGEFTAPSGTPPAAGGSFAGGTVVYVGVDSPQVLGDLPSCTPHYFKAWSYIDGFYSTGLTASATTASPGAPTYLYGSPINYNDFTANWNAVAGVAGYRLDVSPYASFTGGESWATIFRETMGTPTGTTTIAAYEAANGFDNDDYTMSGGGAANPGDVRLTSPSSNYVDSVGNAASGSGNVWLTSTAGEYGFGIAGINAAGYSYQLLSFGYRKESSTTNADFVVQWSTNNGTTWTTIALSNMPATNAPTGWYMISNLYLPAAASSPNLSLRWVKSKTVAMRLDDILLRGAYSPEAFVNGYSNLYVAGTSASVTGLQENTTYYWRVRAEGAGGCVSANSATGSVTTAERLRIVVSHTNVLVREAGEGRFFVRLNRLPPSTVVLNVARVGGSESISVVFGTNRTFKTTNWDVWQAVTLGQGADDHNSTSEEATFEVFGAGLDESVLVTAKTLDDDIGENVALTTSGTTVSRASAAMGAALIDGLHTASTNYGYTIWTSSPPGSFTLDLQFTTTVSRIRVLSWDWIHRPQRYQVHSSLNGWQWTLVADASAADTLGWGDWPVDNATARYIRFTGISSTTNAYVMVSELEVYGSRPLPELIEVSTTAVNVREQGEGRFFVRLKQDPGTTVTLTTSFLSGSEDRILVQAGATRTFNSSNWNVWQAVTLAATDDDNADSEEATFRVSAPGRSAPVTVTAQTLDDDLGANLALGASIRGTRANRVTQLIDGIHTVSTNYGLTTWTGTPPGTITVDLLNAAPVAEVRILNWDWLYRTQRYTIEVSTNGTDWTLLGDASAGDHMGWEVWDAGGDAIRYVRFTGLYNSANQYALVAELEVIAAPQGRSGQRRSASAPAGSVVLISEPVQVLTSDGPADVTGWNAVDRDLSTAWIGQKAGGGYLVIEYSPALTLKALEVDLTENSLSQIEYLYSQDAQDWQPLPEDLEANPVRLNYLWLIFPDDGSGAVPEVIEVRPNP